jgi:pyruvate dehydrogenase E2 component (dihydrolipoamide acetyltransferase)
MMPMSDAVVPILMPQAGNSMEEGTILRWHKGVGDRVAIGEVLFEVETDKANIDVEAEAAGRLARVLVREGDTVAVKTPVALLAERDEDVAGWTARTAVAVASDKPVPSAPAPMREVVDRPESGELRASPAAHKRAAELGVSIGSLGTGSGPHGRILVEDVEAAAVAGPKAVPAPAPQSTRMRKAIGRAMAHSKATVPHFYMKATVEAGALLGFYEAEKAKYPCSLTDVLVLACARAMQEFPQFRTRTEGEESEIFAESNVGLAVALEQGLVVPAVIAAERLSLRAIAEETRRLVGLAQEGKLEGVGKATMTISNLGMFGVEEFTAIISPPEAAILAVGAVRESVAVHDGAIRATKTMSLTLSSDHRVIDGAVAARFMARLTELLTAPEVM